MYTTNIIEGLNRQYRKVTKTKSVFPSDTALEKLLYLASENVAKKWTRDTATGTSFEPADPAVRGTDHTVFIEKNRQGAATQ